MVMIFIPLATFIQEREVVHDYFSLLFLLFIFIFDSFMCINNILGSCSSSLPYLLPITTNLCSSQIVPYSFITFLDVFLCV